MRRLAVWIVVPLAIGAIVIGGREVLRHQREAPLRAVETIVRASLKDPESARFDRVDFNPVTGSGCGLVNAKNSMGGYVGFAQFIARSDGSVEFEPPDDRSGTLVQQLEAAQKKLAFLEKMSAQCKPDEPESPASAAK